MAALIMMLAEFAGWLVLLALFPLPHLLITLAVIAGYALFTTVSPETSCRRCNGWGTSHKRRRRRNPSCKRCAGTGTRFRPGAPLVHRGLALVSRYLRERRNPQ